MKRHKEILFIMGVAFVVSIASHDLFSDQQKKSGLINSAKTITPSDASSRVTCEVPITSVKSKSEAEGRELFMEKLQEKKHVTADSTSN